MIRVAIVEDDPITRYGLTQIITAESDFTLVRAAASMETFGLLQARDVDVVLLDLYLRGGGPEGAEAVRLLVDRHCRVLVLSMSDEEIAVQTAIGAGAHGYLTKEAEPDEIVRAARSVAGGDMYISATVAGFLLRDPARLTEREVEILRMVASGDTTPEIAAALTISDKTVNRHLERIRDKTGYRNKADLTRLAYERGIISRFRRRRNDPSQR
ncbi:response regulator transcription factor [Streptomyces sp. MK7]|uniref:response regulator transcription factor n=1 Tax=Streptomyces sp. MK7 TaxID=3067635 RepID=UPI0029310376|nr:response regulator transcription factor [Streptomyces sp. MK7]